LEILEAFLFLISMSATNCGVVPYTAELEEGVEGSDDWVLEGSPAISEASPVQEPAPDDGMPQVLSSEVHVAQTVVAMDAGELEVVLSIIAPLGESAARAPLHLVAVLDKSGSMHGEKLRLVVETMCFMLQHLTERDTVGFVEYGSEVTVLAAPTRCDASGKARLEKCLRRMKSGGQTNLSGGLLRGIELHGQDVQASCPSQASCPLQRVKFGNTWKRVPNAEESESCPGKKNENEWTAELRFERDEDAALVQKVVYHLHETFKQPVEEVHEAPFRITRKGWGTFNVKACAHLKDGRVLELNHDLVFGQEESFQTRLLLLGAAPVQFAPPARSSESAVPGVVSEHDSSDGAVRSCFLFTDGLANMGISKPEAICQAAIGALDELGARRCTLSTFGFGADHSADLLRSLAKAGGGEYSFIEGEESIGEAFGTVLGGLLSTTHQNVRLSLELAPGVVLSRAKTTRTVESSHSPEGATVLSIDLGDLFAEERRDILISLSLPEAPAEGEQLLGMLRARGFSVLQSRSEDVNPIKMIVQRSAGAREASVINPQVACHQNRYLATTALETARAAGGRGEFSAAQRSLEAAAEHISASDLAAQGDIMTLNMLTDIRECLKDFKHQQAQRSYAESQRSQTYVCNKMASMSMCHERQRACGTASSFNYTNAVSRTMGKTAYEWTSSSKRG
jgi:Mg-chelatase subunit ChlD